MSSRNEVIVRQSIIEAEWYKSLIALSKLLPFFTIVLAIYGFLYLFFYTTSYGIPFPVDAANLIPLLLIVMVMSTVAVVGLMFIAMLPLQIRTLEVGEALSDCWSGRFILGSLFGGILVSVTWAFLHVVDQVETPALWSQYGSCALAIWFVCLLVFFGSMFWFLRGSKQSSEANSSLSTKKDMAGLAASVVFHALGMLLWLVFLAYAYIYALLLFLPDGDITEDSAVHLVLGYGVLSIVLFFVLILVPRKLSNRLATGLFLFALVAPLLPPISTSISGAILNQLKIGGEVAARYRISESVSSVGLEWIESVECKGWSRELPLVLSTGKGDYVLSGEGRSVLFISERYYDSRVVSGNVGCPRVAVD